MSENIEGSSLRQDSLFNDKIDLVTLFSVFLDNFNLVISVFFSGLVLAFIIYASSTPIFVSKSLIEIQQGDNLVPNISNFSTSREEFLSAEVEIYRSSNTIKDVEKTINSRDFLENYDLPSAGQIRSNLRLSTNGKSLVTIFYSNTNKDLAQIVLSYLNEEYIKDRKDFKKRSSAAGREFIKNEIPKIKQSLKKAEDELSTFKLSTNQAGLIFESDSRNSELKSLYDSIDQIQIKELELKEFYKETHPIYLTLNEQKNFIKNKIKDIESDLPNVPNNQRRLANLKREVDLYAGVLNNLSSQEINLAMAEAASNSNVRVINEPSMGSKIKPTFFVFILPFVLSIFIYLIQLLRHFVGDKITNYDALIDFVDKKNIIGELPLYDSRNIEKNKITNDVALEMMNKVTYQLIKSKEEFSSIAIVGSRKGVGKTEVSEQLFYKLTELGKKVCLLDLDYRKKDLSLKSLSNEDPPKNFIEFYENIDKYKLDQSLFVPSFEVENPIEFFMSDEFKNQLNSLKEEYEYVICDTPPWDLFVDAKIVSQNFETCIYVVGNKLSNFKDIVLFNKEIESSHGKEKIKYFFNKFDMFFKLFWLKYQYPNYSGNYYYGYSGYLNADSPLKLTSLLTKFKDILLNRIKKWF